MGNQETERVDLRDGDVTAVFIGRASFRMSPVEKVQHEEPTRVIDGTRDGEPQGTGQAPRGWKLDVSPQSVDTSALDLDWFRRGEENVVLTPPHLDGAHQEAMTAASLYGTGEYPAILARRPSLPPGPRRRVPVWMVVAALAVGATVTLSAQAVMRRQGRMVDSVKRMAAAAATVAARPITRPTPATEPAKATRKDLAATPSRASVSAGDGDVGLDAPPGAIVRSTKPVPVPVAAATPTVVLSTAGSHADGPRADGQRPPARLSPATLVSRLVERPHPTRGPAKAGAGAASVRTPAAPVEIAKRVAAHEWVDPFASGEIVGGARGNASSSRDDQASVLKGPRKNASAATSTWVDPFAQ